MTLSKDDRKANADLALQLILQQIGELACDKCHLLSDSAHYRGILPTTWKELKDSGLVRFLDSRIFKLTGSGWLMALQNAGRIEMMKKDVGMLMAVFRSKLENRTFPAIVSYFAVADEAEVSTDFLVNVVDSQFIETILHRRGVSWYSGRSSSKLLEIPIDFNHDLFRGPSA